MLGHSQFPAFHSHILVHWPGATNSGDPVIGCGPMAQDFKAAFYPGRDDKSISTLEFDGVELAAIQGLNQKVDERDALLRQELQRKDAEIAELRRAVAELVQIVKGQARK